MPFVARPWKQNSHPWACSWSVIRSARVCVGGTAGSWRWSGRCAAKRRPPCRRRRTSEPPRSETETRPLSPITRGSQISRHALITSRLLVYVHHVSYWRTVGKIKLQFPFHIVNTEQSSRKSQSVTRCTICSAVLFKATFWLYTQSEGNMADCLMLTQVLAIWYTYTVWTSCAEVENSLFFILLRAHFQTFTDCITTCQRGDSSNTKSVWLIVLKLSTCWVYYFTSYFILSCKYFSTLSQLF